ncbi:MAG: 2-iminoacetate synthase ThiH [Kiritimatiellae bacterium]|nr:2-iminoacetate synthase ThiH [Kiritimatiellia bacterium]
MSLDLPRWLDPGVRAEAAQLSDLLTEKSGVDLEQMAQRALSLTRSHFGRTITMYAPLYLSNYCSGGCVYCGFASDREQPRTRLNTADLVEEMKALKDTGLEEILLLTGESTREADHRYLTDCVSQAAKVFHSVTVESFSMTESEYHDLSEAGCTGITLYQETYDPVLYEKLHRWGSKRDYMFRLEAPERALSAGLRTVGLGVLLGLGDLVTEARRLLCHIIHLRKSFWRAGIMVSFPRICSQQGGYQPQCEVTDESLAKLIFSFRICFPDVPLVLSTRESREFRDNMAGLGISRMSVASKTTVGGYRSASSALNGQFDVNDDRDVDSFCAALRKKGLDPVFKNWDSVLHMR